MNHSNIIASRKEADPSFKALQQPLNERIGFSRDPIIIPNYFVYAEGIQGSSATYTETLLALQKHTFNSQRPFIRFKDRIATVSNRELINGIQSIFKDMQGQILASPSKALEAILKFPLLRDVNLSSEALLTVLNAYLNDQNTVSETQLKNFITKLLGWFINEADAPVQKTLDNLSKDTVYNPILVYFGDIKTHTEYFLYLCWLSGMDVIYFNTDLNQKPSVLSKWAQVFTWSFKDPHFKYPDWTPVQPADTPQSITVNQGLQIQPEPESENPPAVIKYRETDNLYEDFPGYISNRSGFVRGSTPILPVYFYRVLGIQTDQNLYFNELYKLDHKLKALGPAYIRFENQIPLANDTVFLKSFSKVWQQFQTAQLTSVEPLLNALSKVPAFPLHHKGHYKNLLIHALKATVLEYITDAKVNSIGQVKNLIMKLLMWTQQHLVASLNSFDFKSTQASDTMNPKILYYGNIKKHEAYFLLYASRLGIDILFFNTYEDTQWDTILTDSMKSFIVKFPDKCRIQPFPTKEIHMRSETTAYQASKEIDNVLFNPEGGLFKPWQLDPFKVKAVSLRSTFEEAKTLWPVEARLREHFEVRVDTVYMPNLFFKLSGVYTDHNAYWKLMASLADEKLVKLVEHLPFTEEQYSKTDEYLVNYIMDHQGLLDIKEVQKKQIYKYQHLKTATQTLILETINKVLTSKAYQQDITPKLKQRILLTLLNLPNDVLHLIASFDKPFQIPKFIVFDPDENMFSDADIAILLFLHLIGFDVAIFTPTGYNNIETVLKTDFYDVYRLEDVAFNLNLPDLERYKSVPEKGKSFLSSLFGN